MKPNKTINSKNYKVHFFKGSELLKRKKNLIITMFDFKISMTIKKGDSGLAIEEYNGKAADDNYIRFLKSQ